MGIQLELHHVINPMPSFPICESNLTHRCTMGQPRRVSIRIQTASQAVTVRRVAGVEVTTQKPIGIGASAKLSSEIRGCCRRDCSRTKWPGAWKTVAIDSQLSDICVGFKLSMTSAPAAVSEHVLCSTSGSSARHVASALSDSETPSPVLPSCCIAARIVVFRLPRAVCHTTTYLTSLSSAKSMERTPDIPSFGRNLKPDARYTVL